jgi:hypothetical protein
MSDEPGERSSHEELHQREAGVAKAKKVRLSADPPAYVTAPRNEPGPEAYPPATIQGIFRPIEDRGPETPVPLPQQRTDAQDEPSQGTDLPSVPPGEEEP